MDIATPTLSYQRAAIKVMFFSSVLTLMFESLMAITTLTLKMKGHIELAKGWIHLSGCSMFTAFLFSIGIALALIALGREYVRQRQEAVLLEKV
jgi:hypothetical protein